MMETPVIIIGAGPAGASASIFLTKHKIHHIVIERAVFPRDKVCGDACSGRTIQVINKANPDWLAEMKAAPQFFHPMWGMTIVSPNGKEINIPLSDKINNPGVAKGFVVTRLVLDNFLFEKMPSPYCTVYEGAKVLGIKREKSRVLVKMNYKGDEIDLSSPMIVGADGDKSIVRKTFVGEDRNEKTKAIGLRAYYDGVTGMNENSIELHYFPELPTGYLWIFPLPNGRANVGIGMLSSTARERKVNLRELMLEIIKNNNRLSARFENAVLLDKILGWGLPIYTEDIPVSGDNYMLTGDAANFIDPFSGEGVGNALYSGMLAAEAVKVAIEQKNYSAEFLTSAYDKVFYQHLGPELKQNATMQRMFKNQWFFNLFFNKADKSKSLREVITCMFTDVEVLNRLKSPWFYVKVLFNQ
ncbi:MAG: geranylgeranyl reductase family protein [Taibaiella sp.]|nr:geranylgeranyl reductase family protein [Taibaiella sp.]